MFLKTPFFYFGEAHKEGFAELLGYEPKNKNLEIACGLHDQTNRKVYNQELDVTKTLLRFYYMELYLKQYPELDKILKNFVKSGDYKNFLKNNPDPISNILEELNKIELENKKGSNRSKTGKELIVVPSNTSKALIKKTKTTVEPLALESSALIALDSNNQALALVVNQTSSSQFKHLSDAIDEFTLEPKDAEKKLNLILLILKHYDALVSGVFENTEQNLIQCQLERLKLIEKLHSVIKKKKPRLSSRDSLYKMIEVGILSYDDKGKSTVVLRCINQIKYSLKNFTNHIRRLKETESRNSAYLLETSALLLSNSEEVTHNQSALSERRAEPKVNSVSNTPSEHREPQGIYEILQDCIQNLNKNNETSEDEFLFVGEQFIKIINYIKGLKTFLTVFQINTFKEEFEELKKVPNLNSENSDVIIKEVTKSFKQVYSLCIQYSKKFIELSKEERDDEDSYDIYLRPISKPFYRSEIQDQYREYIKKLKSLVEKYPNYESIGGSSEKTEDLSMPLEIQKIIKGLQIFYGEPENLKLNIDFVTLSTLTVKDLTKKYHSLQLKCHPDKNGANPGYNKEMSSKLNEYKPLLTEWIEQGKPNLERIIQYFNELDKPKESSSNSVAESSVNLTQNFLDYYEQQSQAFDRAKLEKTVEAMLTLRDNANKKLSDDLEKIDTPAEKVDFLKKVRKLTIFNTHRNDGFFETIGRTNARIKIDKKIKELEPPQSLLDSFLNSILSCCGKK